MARGQKPVIVRYLAHKAIDRRNKPWAPLLVHHPICKLMLMTMAGELPKLILPRRHLKSDSSHHFIKSSTSVADSRKGKPRTRSIIGVGSVFARSSSFLEKVERDLKVNADPGSSN